MTSAPLPEAKAEQRNLAKYLFLAVQVVVSLGLLVWVLSGVDFTNVLAALHGANYWLLALAVLILPVHVVANAWRWQYVWPTDPARPEQQKPGIGTLTQLIFIGLFFNQILPPPVGGDAVRTIGAKRLGLGYTAGALSVFIERVWGLITVTLFILPTLPFLLADLLPDGITPTGLAIGLLLVALVGLVVGFKLLLWLCQHLEDRLQKELPVNLIRQLRTTTLEPKSALWLLLLSMLGQLPPLLSIMMIGIALPGDIGAGTALLVAPLALFATVVPISFAGWGLREGVMVTALASQGISSAQALALSLAFGVGLLLISLPGAVLFRLKRRENG